MKIGVALSGCGLEALGALGALEELESQGLEVGMLSACGVSAASALLFGCIQDPDRRLALAERFRRESLEGDSDGALAGLAAHLHPGREQVPPLAVCSTDSASGTAVLFTNCFRLEGERMRTYPLEDAYDALSATASPFRGLTPYRYGGDRLCDFSLEYGVPIHPLRLLGVERVISLAFPAGRREGLYAALSARMCAATASMADCALSLSLPPDGTVEEWTRLAAKQTESCIREVLERTLF